MQPINKWVSKTKLRATGSRLRVSRYRNKSSNGDVSILKTRVTQGDWCRLRDRKIHASCAGQRGTWEMSITASQLRGRAEVRSLKPRRVEMIPFWSILRIMVPSTKKITPYLSTVMPADKKSTSGQMRKISISFSYFVCLSINVRTEHH